MSETEGVFLMCGGCSRKETRENLKEGEFYCRHFNSIFPGGVVTNRTDASACVREKRYQKVL